MNRKAGLLSRMMSAQRKRLMLSVGLSVALAAAIAGQAALLAEAVQRIFVEGATLASITSLLAGLLLVMLSRTLLLYGNGRIGLHMAADAKTQMRSDLLSGLAGASMAASLDGQTGGKVSVALDAVDESENYFSQYMPRMVEASIIPLVLLVVVFSLHANSGLIMLFTAPFIPLFMILSGLSTKKKSEEKFEQLAQFSGTFLDSLQGLVSLKLFGRAARQEREIERSSLAYRDATMDILRIAFTNTFMIETVVMLSIGIVALELALQLVVFKTMQFHTAFLILLLAPEFYNLFKNTGTAFHGGRTSMVAIRKVEALMSELKPAPKEGSEEGEVISSTLPVGLHHPEQTQSYEQPPTITLSGVRFQYRADSFKLNIGQVVIKPGERIAIVGPSGSGKTTLLNLIAGLLPPAAGEIRVDGNILGQHAEELWFKQISYITQHPYIFAGTFAENIAIGAGRDVSREEIVQAAESAGLGTLANELEQGFETYVGEGGRGLSGGEKQRLALARAFLKRPSVILFDEPTVGLDLQTERVLQQSIAELTQHATSITVAHRLYTIRHADRILFMEKGSQVGVGNHEELLARLPQYAEMIAIQRTGGLS
ncbi:thiol reductant ABC exporter subunit CydD [Paenibacillus sanguinis]|uniref:thiol reductant ABC exporter subunit CydD n=1 Tax=Paenibacillus sanguinis TaxID=225906 RepID=UPI00035DAFB9|nr:thiol reductant ABC exporter subunit CydD [Paenibacillus sanguinis]